MAKALTAKSATTLQGESLAIRFADGKVKINDANLMTADLKASNGVIHVIDSVLLPSSAEVAEPESIVGTWVFTKVVASGEERTAKVVNQETVDITETNMTMGENAAFAIDYEIDASVVPNKVKLKITASPYGVGQESGGVIKLDGDVLMLCYGARGGDVPTTFESKPGSGVNLFHFKRAD